MMFNNFIISLFYDFQLLNRNFLRITIWCSHLVFRFVKEDMYNFEKNEVNSKGIEVLKFILFFSVIVLVRD